jgi:hypothetical protein
MLGQVENYLVPEMGNICQASHNKNINVAECSLKHA